MLAVAAADRISAGWDTRRAKIVGRPPGSPLSAGESGAGVPPGVAGVRVGEECLC